MSISDKIDLVTPLRFEPARRCVIETVTSQKSSAGTESVTLQHAAGRVAATDIQADRDYPPFARSIRDGFAVNASGFRGRAQVIGEVRAGTTFTGVVRENEAVEIMTGAPVPPGADAVVMVEHVERSGDTIATGREVNSGDFINSKGSDCGAGEVIVRAGQKIDFATIGALATVGISDVPVFRRPQVSIIATGDEIVDLDHKPADYQIRNSNSYSLAAQVHRAGGIPVILPIARDDHGATQRAIERGLEADLLLLSGGVSAGKYDIVERVLADLGAEFYFDRVLIQPGQPVVFGRVWDVFFFGLPGNPASTMVTFEIFARAAVELLAGMQRVRLPLLYARLREDFRHKPGLTRFLPACLEDDSPQVRPVKYGGSGDVFALARANAFLVAREDRESWGEGDLIEVLPR